MIEPSKGAGRRSGPISLGGRHPNHPPSPGPTFLFDTLRSPLDMNADSRYQSVVFPRRPRFAWTLGLALALTAVCSASSSADLIMAVDTIQGPTGGVGSFEVSLTNTGPSDVTVGGFSIQLNVGAGVQFTGVSTATAANPYIFLGTGTGSVDPNFKFSTDTFPNSSFTASDTEWADPTNGIKVTSGAVFGLALVTYSVVDPYLSGDVPISFLFPGTSLSDPNSVSLTFNTQGGVIHLRGVPEPSSVAMTVIGFAAIALVRIRRRRTATH